MAWEERCAALILVGIVLVVMGAAVLVKTRAAIKEILDEAERK